MYRSVRNYPWFEDMTLIEELRHRLSKHVVPLLGYADATGETVRVHGSGVVVRTNGRRAIVTAAHVIDGYLDLLAREGGAARLVAATVSGTSVPVGEWDVVRSRDRDVDIAALREPPGTSGEVFEPWAGPITPSRAVEVDDVAFVLGFPGAGRFSVGPQRVIGGVSITERVASVSERHFVLVPTEGPRTFHPRLPIQQLTPKLDRVGGLSGAPVFAFVAPRVVRISAFHEPPISRIDVVPEWNLAGVVYEGEGGVNETWLFVAHTRHLPL